ncbi:hypothetical protein FH593_20500 (plasmid) [Leptospira interrogans]|uniref:hypothetical protein n=1 Tax=Leptospira interrogans TaxID=173 RepID=UPI0002BDA04C|nr:hypothetical protein [Leptospira interrogans]EMN60341.1 hypothetical protein LEP1GSC092_0058 [Leptospira interrogans serovar Pyrogenes str. R168]ULG90680.1 hypothetical protein FH593_20795 [Leptospira interrogans]ULG90709.1 hypothetical protein FH593_20500 [Leptospira interrogans]UML78391.1 hypothetical protein FH583_21595 [Leptospira interrogans]UML78447.1 hypothetical protein FH583_21445 [Leptospira interrogans]
MKRYSFQKVIVILQKNGYQVEWFSPYEIKNLPSDLKTFETEKQVIANYVVRFAGRRQLMLTQIHYGAISEMTLVRTIIIGLRLKQEIFDGAIVPEPDQTLSSSTF